MFVGSIVAVAAIVAACQEPDPNYGDPSGIIGKKLPGETGTTGTTSSSSGGDASASSSGGSGFPTATAPAVTLAAAHADGGGPAPPVTADCLSCHGTGPTPKKFAFGGLVSNSAGATVTVVVDGLQPVATDDAGYFWSSDTTAITAGSAVNLYSGTTQDKMPGLAAGNAGGGCLNATGCHGAGSPGPITL